jgi:hypothetical protein
MSFESLKKQTFLFFLFVQSLQRLVESVEDLKLTV